MPEKGVNDMPKGIKKQTAASLRAAIDRQYGVIHNKETALQKAKEDYDAKVRRLKSDITEANAELQKLRKTYTDFIRNEQRETLSTLLFNGDLSADEITKAINAMRALFAENADHGKAIRMLQEIAACQQNTTITHLVNELEAQETKPQPDTINRGLGDTSQAAEQ